MFQTLRRSGVSLRLSNFIRKFSQLILHLVSSRTFLVLTFVWFIIQTLYIAFSTRLGVPPDENYHLGLIKLFTNGWLPFIHNQSGFYSLGEVAHTPFFIYEYLLSLPNHLINGSGRDFFYLRLINIAMAVGSLFIVYKLANLLRLTKPVRNLSLFMLANTLMFVFLSASISYDNLFILFSLSSILLLLLLFNRPTLFRMELMTICLIAGALTKINFLPVAFILFVLLIWKFGRNLKDFIGSLRASATESRVWNVVLALSLILLLALAAQRYVVNLASYHSLAPRCEQALSLSQCRQNYLFNRTERLNSTKRPAATKGTYDYLINWAATMNERTYGIFSHKSTKPTKLIAYGSEIFIALALLSGIRNYSRRNQQFNLVLVIIAFYTFVLILTNYRGYHRYGSFNFAVQGRYLFGVLPLIYLLANKYIWQSLGRPIIRGIYSLAIIVVFLSAGLPSYIYATGPNWHTTPSVKLNSHLKTFLTGIK